MLYTCFQRLFKSPSSYALFSHHSRLQVFWCSADYQSQVHHSSRPQSPLMSQRGRRTKRQWRCALEQQPVKARGPSLLNAGGHLWTDSSGVSASNLPPAQAIKFTLSSSTWPLGSTACHSLRKERKGKERTALLSTFLSNVNTRVDRVEQLIPYMLFSFPCFFHVTMSARPLGLQVSGPAAWDKATINCRAVQRAHGTKSPTRCPCPQTSHETNVTGLAQKGIIRPVSLNTFTYLRALSVQCFVLAQKEGRAWMEGREEVVTWGEVSVCVCACDEREKKTQGGRKGTERMKWTKDAPGFHSDSPSPENTTEFVRNGRRCVCVCVCVCPPPRGRQEVLLIVVFFFPFFLAFFFSSFVFAILPVFFLG